VLRYTIITGVFRTLVPEKFVLNYLVSNLKLIHKLGFMFLVPVFISLNEERVGLMILYGVNLYHNARRICMEFDFVHCNILKNIRGQLDTEMKVTVC
jgi:hypothetical protein